MQDQPHILFDQLLPGPGMDGSADRVEESYPPSDAVNRDRIAYYSKANHSIGPFILPPTQHRQAVDEG